MKSINKMNGQNVPFLNDSLKIQESRCFARLFAQKVTLFCKIPAFEAGHLLAALIELHFHAKDLTPTASRRCGNVFKLQTARIT
jgi:hypothetical protein